MEGDLEDGLLFLSEEVGEAEMGVPWESRRKGKATEEEAEEEEHEGEVDDDAADDEGTGSSVASETLILRSFSNEEDEGEEELDDDEEIGSSVASDTLVLPSLSNLLQSSSLSAFDAKWESLWAMELVTSPLQEERSGTAIAAAAAAAEEEEEEPKNIISSKLRRNSFSPRECLLAETWARKRREMKLHEELKDLKERSKLEMLGRSSSDCGKLPSVHELQAQQQSPGAFACSGQDGKHKGKWRCRCSFPSLSDNDFEELRGCIDLGFRFDESPSHPDLCQTLPALQVYYAVVSHKHQLQTSPDSWGSCKSSGCPQSPTVGSSSPPSPPPWRVASPGDDPKEVKEKLRYWAQAVACNVRLCN